MRHTQRAPTTLTDAEARALLDATGRADDDFRDHLLVSVALGTGLRVSEVVGLNVGDVRNGKGAKGLWTLRPEATKGNVGGTVALPDKLRRKVSRLLAWKGERVSNGMVFLFTVMHAWSNVPCHSLPVNPLAPTSTINRWLSVPPLTNRNPFRWSAFDKAAAFLITCRW